MAMLLAHEQTQPIIEDAKYMAQRMRDDRHQRSRLQLSLIELRAPPQQTITPLHPFVLSLQSNITRSFQMSGICWRHEMRHCLSSYQRFSQARGIEFRASWTHSTQC